jgi:hypothetical protein
MTQIELNGMKEIHWDWEGMVRCCEGRRGSDYVGHENFFPQAKACEIKGDFS